MRLFRTLLPRFALALAILPAVAAHAQDIGPVSGISSDAVASSAPGLKPQQTNAAQKTPQTPDQIASQPSRQIVNPRRRHRNLAHHRLVKRAGTPPSPVAGAIGTANAAARIDPDPSFWHNAIQQYAYADGALYQVYAAPGRVTDIALQEGEELAGSGPVAAGDTVRWIIGDTVSGSGKTRRIHLLVKPTRPDLATNLVINTDRRTYHLELRAQPATYMAALSWTYPQDALIALQSAAVEARKVEPVAAGLDAAALEFRYRIEGDKAPWRPLRAFDDGRQTFIEFPEGIATGDMPPIFVTGQEGSTELVNYQVKGRYMIVDRLFDAAELRLGTKKTQQRVSILKDVPHKGDHS
jgi:type IV secretion system protein VirB9